MNLFQQIKERKVLDKDGKVDALGPYGKSKLTGQEVANYFKKYKIKDPKIKKAVEVALDLGGALDIAGKEIQKFYGRKIRNSKEVKQALKYANESFEMNQLVGILHEDVFNLTEKNLMPDIQKIVDTKGAAKVGGVMLDMFTASMIAKVYDKVNDQNKKKMEKAKIEVLVKLAHKVMGMKEDYILEGKAMPLKKIAKKYKREIEQLAKKGQSPVMGKHKVYMALYNLAWDNGDINTDDPDQTDEVIDDYMDDMMGEFFAHIKDEYVKEWISADGTRRRVHEKDKRKSEKKLKESNPMDTYRQMWEDAVEEDIDEAFSKKPAKGKDIAKKMMKSKTMKGFANKVKRMKTVTAVQLDKMLPDYVSGGDIGAMFEDAVEEETIVEKKEMDSKVIEKIAKLTDQNDHNKAVMDLARYMREMKVVKMMEHMIAMHKINGSMSSDMINIRKEMLDLCLKKAKKLYDNFDDIYKAF